MLDIYFIEYQDCIKFFKDDKVFTLIKNDYTYKLFMKIKSRFNFINLLSK